MAAITPVDVANMALGLLTEAPIDSLDDDERAARMMRLHYETVREAELTKKVWWFSLVAAELVGAPVDDALGYRYELPEDCLRLPAVVEDSDVRWVQRSDGIYTDIPGPIRLVYVANIVDPTDWPSVFTDVLAAALAIKVAHPITQKASMIEVAQSAYDRALSVALAVNAIQRSSPRRVERWEEARGYGFRRYGSWR